MPSDRETGNSADVALCSPWKDRARMKRGSGLAPLGESGGKALDERFIGAGRPDPGWKDGLAPNKGRGRKSLRRRKLSSV